MRPAPSKSNWELMEPKVSRKSFGSTAMICGTFLCVWKRGSGTVLLIMALDEVCLVGTVPWLEELPLVMTTSRRNSFLELFDLLNFQFV